METNAPGVFFRAALDRALATEGRTLGTSRVGSGGALGPRRSDVLSGPSRTAGHPCLPAVQEPTLWAVRLRSPHPPKRRRRGDLLAVRGPCTTPPVESLLSRSRGSSRRPPLGCPGGPQNSPPARRLRHDPGRDLPAGHLVWPHWLGLPVGNAAPWAWRAGLCPRRLGCRTQLSLCDPACAVHAGLQRLSASRTRDTIQFHRGGPTLHNRVHTCSTPGCSVWRLRPGPRGRRGRHNCTDRGPVRCHAGNCGGDRVHGLGPRTATRLLAPCRHRLGRQLSGRGSGHVWARSLPASPPSLGFGLDPLRRPLRAALSTPASVA